MNEGKNAALILEGGAMRGIFTAGVLDVLMEHNCYLDYVVGVSAGSCNGADYVSRQIGRSRDCIAVADESIRYVHGDLPHMIRGKAFDLDRLCGDFAFRYFPFDFETYFASDIGTEYVVTNARTGRAEYLNEKSDPKRLMNIIAASCSMPLINKLRPLDGGEYSDGGIADSIPIIHAMRKGYRKNVVVLTRPKSYRKERNRALETLYKAKYRKYPELVKALCRRHIVYNRTLDLIDKWEAEGRIFVIRPEGPVVGRTEQDTEKLLTFYRSGIDQMEQRYGELERYLSDGGADAIS
jgi:predicted patatin/cPLA2 family phospholipase